MNRRQSRIEKLSIVDAPQTGKYYVNCPEIGQEQLELFSSNGISPKVIIVGNPAVGKSSLLNRMAHNEFTNEYKSTIGVSYTPIEFLFNNVPVKLAMWDMAGQEQYNSVNKLYFRGANVVFLCFDLGNPQSFNDIEKWRAIINENTSGLFGVFLVGCKSDLQKKISENEIKNYCIQNKLEYFETSSKAASMTTELAKRSCFIASCSIQNLRTSFNHNKITLSEPQPMINSPSTDPQKKCC